MKKLIKGFVKTDAAVWMWLLIACILAVGLLGGCTSVGKTFVLRGVPSAEGRKPTETGLYAGTVCIYNLLEGKNDTIAIGLVNGTYVWFTYDFGRNDAMWITLKTFNKLLDWLRNNKIGSIQTVLAPNMMERLRENDKVDE